MHRVDLRRLRFGLIAGILPFVACCLSAEAIRAERAIYANSEVADFRDMSSALARSAQRPLGEARLRALLSNAHVTPAVPGGVSTSHAEREFFSADGTYLRIGNRTRMEGRFVIRGDRVCVRAEGMKRLCRRIVPGGNGTYLFVNPSDGSSTLMSVTTNR
jgi:hypothetical protein